MNRSHHQARAFDARRPMPTAVVLLILVAQVTACQPDTDPGSVDQTPDPTQPDNTTQVQTSPYSLTSAPGEAPGGPRQPPANCASPGVLTTESALGPVDFRYDAFVVTARESGTVIIQSDVIEANPNGYKYGYGYPLSMATIEDGVTFTAGGGSFYQNALETGTAVTDYPVQAGRQYVIVYKTFGSFTPLTYCLTLPPTLTIEGRIYTPPTPVPIPANSTGPITLQNPRPDALKRLMLWLNDRVSRN